MGTTSYPPSWGSTPPSRTSSWLRRSKVFRIGVRLPVRALQRHHGATASAVLCAAAACEAWLSEFLTRGEFHEHGPRRPAGLFYEMGKVCPTASPGRRGASSLSP